MFSIVLYFHVHQPWRLKPYSLFDVGSDPDYFNQDEREGSSNLNKEILQKVAKKCYFPANKTLMKLLEENIGFKFSFSISGILLDQLSDYAPEVVDSFDALVKTKRVELVNGTYHHSLASLFSEIEFKKQILLHKQKLNEMFGVDTRAFGNAELVYNNDIARIAEDLGFEVILAEGVDRYLGWRSPDYVYRPLGTNSIRLLMKNYRLSDDIAFRFSDKTWSGWPMTANKFVDKLTVNRSKRVINIFMDYETFGEHQWEDSGIFEFLQDLPKSAARHGDVVFRNVTEAAKHGEVKDIVDIPEYTSWADKERNVSAWVGNSLQRTAAELVFKLEERVRLTKSADLVENWRRLTTSDHFYYMSTKSEADGEVHKYFSPYKNAYDAYVNYMNVLHDFRLRLNG